ncbi:MAG: hypothetical protein IKS48_01135 [Eubacterium sp.]|nr:hypothetical protein [Eubacterium sp.]
MNKKDYIVKHCIILLLAVSALVFAFYMPMLAFSYEDYKLNNYTKPHNIKKPYEVESAHYNLVEKLEAARDNMMISAIPIPDEVSLEQYNDNRVANLDNDSAWDTAKDILINQFAGQSLFQIKELDAYKEKINSLPDYYEVPDEDCETTSWKLVSPYLLVAKNSSTILFWQVYIYEAREDDESGNILTLNIDDETGLLLNMYGNKKSFGVDITTCCKHANVERVIGDYYGLQFNGKSIRQIKANRKDMPFDNPEEYWREDNLNFLVYSYDLYDDNDMDRVTVDFVVPEEANGMFLFNGISLDEMVNIEDDNDLTDMPASELDDILYEDYSSSTDAEE